MTKSTTNPLRVLVVGCGHMGRSHAKAYRADPAFEISGIVGRGKENRAALQEELGQKVPEYTDFSEALSATKPDAVCIATYPDTHACYAISALQAGAHVFVEKPLAESVDEALRVCQISEVLRRKVVVGYILRQHPSWIKLTEIARTLGKPLVMRMNLNQQSSGNEWRVHRNLMLSLSPMVDCGVHYLDVMCQMTRSRPVRVHAIGARLTEEISPNMYNYGALHVSFEDGSVGWYEAGWGPMMSQQAYFVKDIIGPKGSVSIVTGNKPEESDSVASHTKTGVLRVHKSELDANGEFAIPDEIINTEDEPGHDALCALEQAYFLKAIREDLDLKDHLQDALNSLRIALAADRSVREGRSIKLP